MNRDHPAHPLSRPVADGCTGSRDVRSSSFSISRVAKILENSYGQFCTVACGAEVPRQHTSCRPRIEGAARFNELRHGIPRTSTSLLVQWLRHLEEIGMVRHASPLRSRQTTAGISSLAQRDNCFLRLT